MGSVSTVHDDAPRRIILTVSVGETTRTVTIDGYDIDEDERLIDSAMCALARSLPPAPIRLVSWVSVPTVTLPPLDSWQGDAPRVEGPLEG